MNLSDRHSLVLVLSCEKNDGCSSCSLAQYARICLRRREQSEGVCTLSCGPPSLLPLLVTAALVHAMASLFASPCFLQGPHGVQPLGIIVDGHGSSFGSIAARWQSRDAAARHHWLACLQSQGMCFFSVARTYCIDRTTLTRKKRASIEKRRCTRPQPV